MSAKDPHVVTGKSVSRRRGAMALEPRMMFDAALVETAVETADSLQSQAIPERSESVGVDVADALKTVQTIADTNKNDLSAMAVEPLATEPSYTILHSADPVLNAGRKDVVFVDSAMTSWESLVSGIASGAEIVLLDGSKDGLAQMAAWADGKSDYDAIHVLSHGAEGQITLGTLTLDRAATQARPADLAALGSVLTADGDLLLYGCNVASGEGEAFLAAIADLTDADVAASDDLTGAAILGGDWALEQRSGAVEAEEIAVSAYAETLSASAPTLDAASSVPADGATAVSVSADIVLDFNEPITWRVGQDYTL